MAKINQDLIDRIQDKLGIGQRAVYNRVNKTGREHRVTRLDIAALLLAWELGINVRRYANREQLDRLEGATSAAEAPTRTPNRTLPVAAGKTKPAKRKKQTKDNSVFVVHGRDEALRRSMFEFLRALGLNPMEWEQAVHHAKGVNPDVREIIDSAMARVQAVVVLLSPDEIAYLKDHFCGKDDKATEGKPNGQARPNVLFEAGLALGAHPEKTVIVQVGKVRPFSDLAGKHLVKLTDDTGKRNDLANRLAKIGCDVSKVGSDWMNAGTFEPTEPKSKKKKSPAAT